MSLARAIGGSIGSALVRSAAPGVDLNFPLTLGSKLVAWWSGRDRSTQYQDSAGTTPVTAGLQTVQRILDKSGNGYHLKRNSGHADAAKAATGYGTGETCVTFWPVGAGPNWVVENGLTHETANRRYFLGCQDRGWSLDPYLYQGPGLNIMLSPSYVSGYGYVYISNAQASGSQNFDSVRHPGPRNVWQWRFASSGITMSNQYFTQTRTNSWFTNTPMAMSGSFFIGAYFDLFDWVVTTDDLTAQEGVDLLAWMRARINEPLASSFDTDINLMLFGDSITSGYGSETLSSWPRMMFNSMGYEPRWAQITASGARIQTVGSLDLWVNGGYGRNIAVYWLGTNDIYVWSRTAAQAQADLETKVAAALAGGADEVYVLTMLKRAGASGALETERQTYNGTIASRAGAVGYSVIDVAARSEFSNTANTTYFADTIHLKNAGLALVAADVKSALGL